MPPLQPCKSPPRSLPVRPCPARTAPLFLLLAARLLMLGLSPAALCRRALRSAPRAPSPARRLPQALFPSPSRSQTPLPIPPPPISPSTWAIPWFPWPSLPRRITPLFPAASLSPAPLRTPSRSARYRRSEEHTSELQSQSNLVCRLLL